MLQNYFIKKRLKRYKSSESKGLPLRSEIINLLVLLPEGNNLELVKEIKSSFKNGNIFFLNTFLNEKSSKEIRFNNKIMFSLTGAIKNHEMNVILERDYDAVINLNLEHCYFSELVLKTSRAKVKMGMFFHEGDGQMITFTKGIKSPKELFKKINTIIID
jgi:hypothetical protein